VQLVKRDKMKKRKIQVVLFVPLLILACKTPEQKLNRAETKSVFTSLPSEVTGITFVNEIQDRKDFNVFKYRNFYNGGGAAIGDINNDGLPDIFLTANMKENRLYLNKGGFKFEDISHSAGVAGRKPWDTGVLMVDVNGDGLLDIYVSNAGNMEGDNHDNDLYINNGNLTFTERAKEYNLAESGFSTHASFFDYDKDGDLDAYLLNNSNVPVSSLGYAADRNKKASDWQNVPKQFRGIGHLLLRNDNGKFVDVSEEAGIYRSLIAFGLGILVTDINEDTYPDIYISNDFYERDYLYINQRNGTFKEEIKDWTSHLCLSAMGVDIADINNDGLKDIFITDMMPETVERTKKVMEFENYDVFKLKQSRDFHQQYIQNTLQLNNGNNSFTEIAYYSGVARTDWSWAGLIFDMDNDGYKDIYVTNGIIHDLTDIDFVDFLAHDVIRTMVVTGDKDEVSGIINKMPVTQLANYAFRNNKDLTFENVADQWGLGTPSFSNGCAYGDLDLDGDLDLIVNNVNMEAFVYRNESSQVSDNQYLQLQLQGIGANKFAVGSAVTLFVGDSKIVQELMPSRGFQSSMDYLMTFGLGQTKVIDSISVIWPDGRITALKNVKSNQKLTLSQQDARDKLSKPAEKKISPLLSEVKTTTFEPHREDSFDDFDQEGLLVKQISKEGPALAIGDINEDGNDDIFIGGGKDQAGVIYLHEGGGKLRSTKNACFDADASFEDTAAAFFDADGDGDLDLVVGSGGNVAEEKANYHTRLYLNDGKGAFAKANTNLQASQTDVAVIKPYDFDGDGDTDLFVGSRNVPGTFGINPEHFFLINNGDGTFSNVTERYAYDLKSAGLITDAKWVDVDGDKKQDLVTVSEWGTPLILKNSGRRLSRMQSSLDSLFGWWKSMESADLDGDGDEDFVFGNAGKNIPFVPSHANPVKLWINDFDENGTIEQIMSVHYDNGDFPIHMRREMMVQLPGLKKQNLKATDYSKRTVQQLFNSQVVNNSLVRKAEFSTTILAINEGNGKFTIRELPARVQWSCVCGISCTDVNDDGNLDLVMGGNHFDFKPQFSRQDGSFGHVLLGDGKLGFNSQNFNESGFFVREEIRHLKSFADKNGKKYFFAAINSDRPRVFKLNQQ
jgi:enediyne biosynthesis protein E4